MKKNLKSILQKLERIEENQMGQLQGGFTSVTSNNSPQSAFASDKNKDGCIVTNNCHGGNCTKGCGM